MELDVAQNVFHKSLESFFFGGFNSRGTNYFYPFVQSLSPERIKNVMSPLINGLSIYGDIENCTDAAKVSELLCRAYGKLRTFPHEVGGKNIQKITINNFFDPLIYPRDRKSRSLVKLIDYLGNSAIEEFVDTVIIHGSYSTRDYVENVSDLDMLILVKENTLADPSKLQKLQSICYRSLHWFYQIDPLQHHGYFLLTPFDLEYFPQTYFPTFLYDYSTLVFGSKSAQVTLRSCDTEKKSILHATLRYLGKNNPGNINNIHVYKLYFSVLQLLPIAYFQYLGVGLYKKYSFKPFEELFPISSEIFRACLKLRNKWLIPTLQFDFLGDTLYKVFPNPKTWTIINNKIDNKVPEYMYEIVGNNLYEGHILPLVNLIESEIEEL